MFAVEHVLPLLGQLADRNPKMILEEVAHLSWNVNDVCVRRLCFGLKTKIYQNLKTISYLFLTASHKREVDVQQLSIQFRRLFYAHRL